MDNCAGTNRIRDYTESSSGYTAAICFTAKVQARGLATFKPASIVISVLAEGNLDNGRPSPEERPSPMVALTATRDITSLRPHSKFTAVHRQQHCFDAAAGCAVSRTPP